VQIQAWLWRRPFKSAVSRRATDFLRAVRRARRDSVKADPAAHEWQWYLPLFDRSLRSGCPVMRRKVNGEWQYRSPTPAEEADYIASESW
jgi:hypothetical protein